MRHAYRCFLRFIVLFVAISTDLIAQSGSLRVTIPSPTAASLGKFGDVPVNLYSGVPDISVPLFVVKGRTLELPIQLKYHAGGIRVQEIGGWAGTGWALEAGGVITRTVRGLVDEKAAGYYYTGHNWFSGTNWPTPTPTLLSNLKNELVDGEPDQFFFNFGGRAGQFAIGPTSTSTTVKDYRTFPQQKLSIVPVIVANSITEWTITTEDGTRYRFAAVETTTDFNVTNGMPLFGSHYGESYASSWQLTSITSTGGDVINFAYSPYTARHRLGTYADRNEEISAPGGGACVASQTDVTNEAETVVQRLLTITAAAHTVTFATALRTDALSPTGVQQEQRLDLMTVASPNATVIRKFKFDHDYSTGRLTLRNVFEQDAAGVSLPPHSFIYSPTVLPAITSFSQDHWGYYNGKGNSGLIPPTITSLAAYNGADRSPDAAFAKAGSLTKITYPTGGYSQFTYELNAYGAVGSNSSLADDGPVKSQNAVSNGTLATANVVVGGLQTVIGTVTVTQSPSGCGGTIFPPCPYTELIVGANTYRWDANLATFYIPLTVGTHTISANGQGQGTASISIQWREKVSVSTAKLGGGLRVSEIRTGDSTGAGNYQIRKYLYTLQADPGRSSGAISAEPRYDYGYGSSTCNFWSRSSQSKMPLGSGPGVGYREVTVQYGATGEFGKARHSFRTVYDVNDPAPPNTVWPFSRRNDFEWQRGMETSVFDLNASGQAQRAATSGYTFAATSETREFRGISFNALSMGQYGSVYLFNPFALTSNWAFLDNEVTTTYDQNGANSFQTAKTYLYGNPVHGQLTQLTETNSDGTQRVTRMKYPADYGAAGSGSEALALAAMQGATHNHSAVIERWVNQKVGATETTREAQVTTFKLFGAGQYTPYQTFVFNNPAGVTNFVPSTVTGTFTKDSRYLLQETANTYDVNGRITQLTDPRAKVTNYLYGGNANNAFLTKVTRVKDAGLPTDLVTDLAYDANTGYLTSIKEEGGTSKFFTYDSYGRLRQVKNNGSVPVRAYGYTYSRTLGNGWVYQSGTPNAVADTTFIQTGVSVVGIGYLDGLGRPVQSLVKDGAVYHTTATQYDLMGRTWRVWKAYPKAPATYDPSFATAAVTHYDGYLGQSPSKPYVETQYTTDALSRVSKVIPEYVGSSATAFSQYFYGADAAAKQTFTEVTDESAKKTRNFATIFGAGVKTILGYGATEVTTTNFAANILGQRTQATDPRGLNTTYSWDTRGLLTSKTSPDAGTAQQKYDKAGNLRFSQDAKQAAAGAVYFTNYDFAGRPGRSGQGTATFASLDPDAAPPAFETTDANALVVRAYDAKPSTGVFPWTLFSTQITAATLDSVRGRLAAVASRSNGSWQATLFSYDTDGRVKTRYTYTHANGGTTVLTALNTTTTYIRDLRDALTQRNLTVGTSTFNHWYDYDGRGLLWKVFASTTGTKPGSPDVTYTYRPSGQVDTRAFLGGPSVALKYTIREQLATVGDPALTTYPFSAKYSYHPNGTISEAEFYNAGSPAAAKRYKYAFGTTSYDALNRLKSADFSSWSGSAWTTTLAHDLAGITYDLAGNLTGLQRYRETATLLDNLTYTNAASSNRLNSVTDAVAVTAETWDAETGSFTYDVNGNLATAPAPYAITAVTYDHQNLPISLTRSGTTTAYRYHDGGQRITKQVGAGNAEYYVLEGATNLGVFTVTSGGTVASSFFNVLAGDKVIGRQPSVGNRRYYHGDLLGSTRSVVEGATVVESYDFEPWGLLMPGRTLGSGTKEGFTGKEQDAETGLDYFGARYYLPALGRWGAVDPAADQFLAFSSYSYSLNSPLGMVDPDGRAAQGCCKDLYRMAVGAVDAAAGTAKSVFAAINFANRLLTKDPAAIDAVASAATSAYDDPSGTAMSALNATAAAVLQPMFDAVSSDDPERQGAGLFSVALAGLPLARLGGVGEFGVLGVDAAEAAPSGLRTATTLRAPDFVVTPKGEVVPVPTGASGPVSTRAPGVQFTGGSGGKGLDARVTGVRVMEANGTQGRRAVYMNRNGQTVDPKTGKTVPKNDPRGHQYLEPWE